MPTYVCTVTGTHLTDGQKSEMAQEITRAHTRLTSAPHYFAQVFFQAPAPGDHFVGGSPCEARNIFIRGEIRAGRGAEVKGKLLEAIVEAARRITGIGTTGIWVYLNELPPSHMIEFGRVLPEPGTEKEWLNALPAAEREQIRRLGQERSEGD
jgi:phenylpyruvate tautomerase PptA (4-oxalocrotonate tautomerase family)